MSRVDVAAHVAVAALVALGAFHVLVALGPVVDRGTRAANEQGNAQVTVAVVVFALVLVWTL